MDVAVFVAFLVLVCGSVTIDVNGKQVFTWNFVSVIFAFVINIVFIDTFFVMRRKDNYLIVIEFNIIRSLIF